ncbi:MAG: XrtA/PEP-CTERM system exopolysaccharide export protein [Pseudomonadota bacterium]
MKKWIFVLGMLVACGFLLSGCGTPRAVDRLPVGEAESAVLVDQYLIGVDDVVQISVWRNPDLDASVPVRPDGKISVPLIGDVQAAGRTPEQVAEVIKQELSTYIKNPLVAVIMTALNSHEYLSRIRVTGAVRSPVTIAYRQGMTVLDAVLAAGGPNEFANSDRSQLIRKSGDNPGSFDILLNQILSKGDLQTNYNLRPGDVITVPERVL